MDEKRELGGARCGDGQRRCMQAKLLAKCSEAVRDAG